MRSFRGHVCIQVLSVQARHCAVYESFPMAFCELEYEEEAADNICNYVPEKKVTVRSDLLGHMNEQSRKREYKKICEFFSNYAPIKHWSKIQEF